MLNLKWSKNNKKLKKLNTISFNLPAYISQDGFKVCPKAGMCANICYARQGRYFTNSVKTPREHNLSIIRKKGCTKFEQLAIADLKKIRKTIIRIHDSGDFFSQEYLNSWYSIIRQFPNKRFYAYTKSLHLDLWTNKPDNLSIIQSYGGLLDNQINLKKAHAKIFINHERLKKSRYINTTDTDQPAIDNKTHIGLVYHGTRKLTDQQQKYLEKKY